ncbi:MAG: serine hydroxymethyltransferase, partial [Anaerococcus sp.]|nr:serine hydroxymethyltransferase [Anaerococcus sp.]
GGPLEHIIAAKAIGFKQNLDPSWLAYAKQIKANAKQMEISFKKNDFDLVSGGTDNHLLLLDLRNMGITGKEAQNLLDEVYITTNKNAIPGEELSPNITSGLRIGTAAVTTRGMKESEMETIVNLIKKTLKKEDTVENIRKEVVNLTNRFPVYGEKI